MACDTDGTPLGVGRVHLEADCAQIRYMAVEDHARNQGVGSKLLEALESAAAEGGATMIFMHAREAAVRFYETHGYRVIQPSHTLYDVIKHYRMEKRL